MEKNLAEIQKLVSEISRYVSGYAPNTDIPDVERAILLQKTCELYDQLKFPQRLVVETVENTDQPVAKEEPRQGDDILFVVEEPQHEVKQEVEPIVETTSQEKAVVSESLGDNFTPKQVTDLGSKLGRTPIPEIMKAIGINNQFRFRSELFQKNQDLFTETVAVLNGLSSFDEAMAYLKKNFNWDYENPAVVEFLSIVERRYL